MSWSRRRRPRIRIPPRSPFLLLHSRRCVETASNKCWKRRKNGSTIRVGPPVRILLSRRAAEARCENRCNRRRTRWMDSLSPPVRVLQSKSSAEVPAANIGAKLVARSMPNRSRSHGRETLEPANPWPASCATRNVGSPPVMTTIADTNARTIGRRCQGRPGGHVAIVPRTAPMEAPNPIVIHEFVNGSVRIPMIAAGRRDARRVPIATMAERTRISRGVQAIDSFHVIEYFRRISSMILVESGRFGIEDAS